MPMPAWQTTQAARSRTGVCGTKRSMRMFEAATSPAGSMSAVVMMTSSGSPANARQATSASVRSFWNSVEQVTSTSWRRSPSSQAGGAAGGSQSPGPTRRTLAGQSLRGYSNGSAV